MAPLRLADSPDPIIPGHDPQVFLRCPSAGGTAEGISVRLDLPLVKPMFYAA